MLGRIELPQKASPVLAWKDLTNEHNLDHVDEFDPLGDQVLNARLEPSQLTRRALGEALLLPGGESQWNSGSKFWGRRPVSVARLGDVEPPLLPPLHHLREGAFGPGNIRHLAQHGTSALCLLTAHHLRLHIEGLQP